MATIFRPSLIFRNWQSDPAGVSTRSQGEVWVNRQIGLYSDILFDAASSSGYQTAQSSYSWSHTCSGANRFLTVGISMLSVAGSSVSSITYAGVPLSKIGSRASLTGAVRVEMWGLVAPALGSNTIAVTLSAPLDSIGSAVSFSNVQQVEPYEGENDASATNVGAADATVNVTTIANNDWTVDVVASDDTAITVGAGQTQRNNVSGTLGSGGMSTEGTKTPPGVVTMSWTNIGALATWSILSIALRPVTTPTIQPAQYDWPNPRGPAYAVSLGTWLQGFKPLYIQPQPFAQRDWPNPKGAVPSVDLRSHLDPLKLNLQGQDTFFGLAGHPNFDWPNPSGPTPAISLKTHLDPTKLNLIGQDRFFGVAGNPQRDWPNPWGPLTGISLRTHIDVSKIWLRGQDTFFGLAGNPNFDQPNPRGAIPSIDLRTWVDPLKLNLQGQDKFFGLAGNPNFDQPNPRGPTAAAVGWLQSFQLQLQAQAAPFVNSDQPNPPRGAVGSVSLLTWTDPLKLNLQGQDQFFGLAGNPNYDWAVPKGRSASVDTLTWLQGFQLQLQAQAAPFKQADWPNPRGAASAVSLLTWVDQLKLNLQGQDTFFGLAGHPNFDWPNPRGPASAVSLLTWTDPLKLNLQGQDRFFGLAGHPNFDQPNPRGAVGSISLLTWLDPLKLNLQGRDQFFGLAGNPNFDWPVPNGKAFPVEYLTWLQRVQLQLFAQAPFAQSDWQNPRGAQTPVSLLTWADPLKLNLRGQDTFFGLAGHPLFDQPNPRGAVASSVSFTGPNLVLLASIVPPVVGPLRLRTLMGVGI